MGWFVVIVAVLVVVAVLVAKLKPQEQTGDGFPYIKNQVLFTPAERSFLGVLEHAVGEDYRVFGKIRVADVVRVKSLGDRSARQRAFNRINAKHFDFILCSKGDLAIVAAIELDDKSHERRDRRERDSFLVSLCQAASLPLIRVPAKRAYSVQALRSQVLASLGMEQEPAPELPTLPTTTPEAQPAQTEPEHSAAEPIGDIQNNASADVPACPKCSASMVRRQAKAGANAGQEFWGCSAFPKCRTIIPLSDQPSAAVESSP